MALSRLKYRTVDGGLFMDYKLIGSRIREHRKQKCISQEKLAEMIHVSATYVGAVEHARKRPSLMTLVKMANALGTTTDSFLRGNLCHDMAQCANELDELLQDCTPYERHMILTLVKTLKGILRQSMDLLHSDHD